MPRATPLLGPEPWKTVEGIPFVVWDLWLMVMSLVGDEIGLDGVEEKLREQARKPGGGSRDSDEAKLSQLDDLRQRLAKLHLTPEDLVLEEVKDKKIITKARTKVYEQSLGGNASTEVMRQTPRAKLDRRAKVGYWPRFPIDPGKYAPELLKSVNASDFYQKGKSMRLARRLHSRWLKLSAKVQQDVPEALALHRAMLTVCHAAQDRANDSYGAIGDVFTEAIKLYEAVPWEKSGIEPEIYIGDIIEFATWENYGQSDELTPIITGLSRRYGNLAVQVFAETVTELESFGLFAYQVDQTIAFWSGLLIAHERFDEFVPLATRSGSRTWGPIVRMAEAAMKSERRDLAVAVFAAANQPGLQQAFLAKECTRITGRDVPKPTLRRVK